MPYVTINKKRCFYRLSKKAHDKKKTIIFIHGSGGEGSVWGYQLGCLSESFKLVIPDLPGHGKTEGVSFETVKEYAFWIKDLAEALGLSSFYLAGHSLGGAIAQEYAFMSPEKTEGLILVASGLYFDISTEYLDLLQNDFEKAVRVSCNNAYAGNVAKEHYQKGLKMLLAGGKKTLYRDMLACKEFNGLSLVPSRTIPSLILCGNQDRITVPELSRRLADKIADSRLFIVPDCGHMVMIEAYETLNREIENFVIKERV